VVLLVGILAVAGLPTLARSLDERQVAWMARQLMSDLSYLQALAVKDGNQYALAFDTAADSYRAVQVTSIVGIILTGDTLEHPIGRKDWVISFAEGSEFSSLRLGQVDFVGKEWVAFDASGAPDTAGEIRLVCGEFERRINVAAGTGRVTVTE